MISVFFKLPDVLSKTWDKSHYISVIHTIMQSLKYESYSLNSINDFLSKTAYIIQFVKLVTSDILDDYSMN